MDWLLYDNGPRHERVNHQHEPLIVKITRSIDPINHHSTSADISFSLDFFFLALLCSTSKNLQNVLRSIFGKIVIDYQNGFQALTISAKMLSHWAFIIFHYYGTRTKWVNQRHSERYQFRCSETEQFKNTPRLSLKIFHTFS